MKVAICDDYAQERQGLVELLRQYRPDWQIWEFESGELLVDAVQEGKSFDLVFLDIFMHQLNGLETAKILRNMACDSTLVFCSTSRDFAVESYEVDALFYLVKPVSPQRFLEVIARFEANYRPRQIRLGQELVELGNILYVESQDKKVVATLRNGSQVSWTAKLDEAQQQVIGKQFLRCHRSYIINMDAVNRVKSGKFLLDRAIEIPMRRQNIAELTETYYRYITS